VQTSVFGSCVRTIPGWSDRDCSTADSLFLLFSSRLLCYPKKLMLKDDSLIQRFIAEPRTFSHRHDDTAAHSFEYEDTNCGV